MSWTITMRQERRRAIEHPYDFERKLSNARDKECYVLLCAQAHNKPVFVVEYLDGTCNAVSIDRIQFLKEEDECSE